MWVWVCVVGLGWCFGSELRRPQVKVGEYEWMLLCKHRVCECLLDMHKHVWCVYMRCVVCVAFVRCV